MVQRIISFISFLILLSTFGYSQNYSYQQYTTEDGLPTNYVYGVLEDQKGYIWAYTENGVSKFDGYEFKNFSVEDGLINNDIILMEEDSMGVLWLHGLHNYIQYIKNDSIHTFGGFDENDKIRDAKYSCNTNNSNAEYHMIRKKNITERYNLINGQIVDSILVLEISDTSRFYNPNYRVKYFSPINKNRFYNVSHDGTIYYEIYKDSLLTWKLDRPLQHTNRNNYLFSPISRESTFNLNVSENEILFIDIIQKKKKRVIISELFGSVPKETSFQYQNDLLIVQTSLGYAEIDMNWNILKIIRFENDITQYGIKRSTKDKKGNLWVGTRDAGLLLFTKSYLKNPIINSNHIGNQSFNKLFKNESGTIYSLSDNAELCEIDDIDIKHISKFDLSNVKIRNIAKGPNGNLLISNAIKTVILKNNKTYNLTEHPYFKNLQSDLGFLEVKNLRRFDDLYFNAQKNQLFCTYPESRAIVLTKKDDHFIKSELDLIGKMLFHDQINDLLYVSTTDGLVKIKENWKTQLEFELKAITSFLCVNKNTYLIGTESNGLYQYARSSKILTKLNSNSYIRKIYKEDEFYYLATNEGVVVGKIKNDKWQHIYTYNKKDGLQSEEIRDMLIFQNNIYATSFRGIIKLDKQSIFVKNRENIYCKALSINEVFNISKNTSVTNKHPVFQYNKNDISFSYHLQNFDSNGDIQYEYKLDPIQSEWQTTTDRTQRFFNLQAADYTFHLKATDAFGHEYYLKEPYTFQIKNPFWKTWWFAFISILILISGILYYLKIKADRSQREVEAEKALNTKISRFKIEALRSQMNPHFVFNALSSIQFYIQKNNAQKADQYLTMFGGLIRKYLDFSQVKSITIKDEIELLQDYLRLEEMRFESLFTSEIIVDPRLDIHYSYIPTMLVQPYVENAINHGLQQRRDGKGIIWIEFKKIYTDGLRISINDNGIGIENSKKNKSDYHKSHGMSNIMDRISFLKESQELEIDLQINTVTNNSEFPGTKIIIEIKEL